MTPHAPPPHSLPREQQHRDTRSRSTARSRWIDRVGLRTRAAAAGGVLTLLGLIAAGLIALTAVHTTLGRAAEQQAEATAQQIADAYSREQNRGERGHGDGSGVGDGGGVGDSSGKDTTSLQSVMTRQRIRAESVQVVSASGEVTDAFPAFATDPITAGPETAVGEAPLQGADGDTGNGDTGGERIRVAASMDSRDRALASLRKQLLIGVPLAALAGTTLIYLVLGGALRPVTRMAKQVDAIRAEDLSARVDVPPTRDELARLADTMNRMLTRLETADETQRRFITDASHELRSPLAVLTTMVEVAERTKDPALLADLRQQTARLSALVADLLDLSKTEESASLVRTDVDLDDVVDAEVRLQRQGAAQLDWQVRIEPVRIQGDDAKLRRVVANLLSNAVRHAQSCIEVRLVGPPSHGDQHAVLTVINDGDPIPPEDRERVFDRFVRLDASRTRDTGGSGLGLSIARGIARGHGGELVAEQTADGRTCFQLTLPVE